MDSWILLLFVAVAFGALLLGYPVALTLGGISTLAGLWLFGFDFFALLPMRVFGTLSAPVMVSVPLFIFMGTVLERSGLAGELLETMARLMGRVRGGLALSVVVVGAMLAASTGVVGATVVTMGMISLPVMLRKGYSPALAAGTIAASGTLGQIIPPSIALVLLGSVLSVSVGKLFTMAIVPGMALVALYCVWILLVAYLRPGDAPVDEQAERMPLGAAKVVRAFVLPFALIAAVLGSIFWGIATPTEAAAVGAAGACLLALLSGTMSRGLVWEAARQTVSLTSMMSLILVGATAFSLIFRALHGERVLMAAITDGGLSATAFLLLVMGIVFVAGFFIDILEIIFIIVPVAGPIAVKLGIDPLWFAILVAINLQTSYLTPPFGFALFFLKGVAPAGFRTADLYRGALPFVVLQLLVLAMAMLWPQSISWILPK